MIKEKIVEELGGKKEFRLSWANTSCYEKIIKAKNKEEAEDMFYDGEIGVDRRDIVDEEMIENSLEIEEN